MMRIATHMAKIPVKKSFWKLTPEQRLAQARRLASHDFAERLALQELRVLEATWSTEPSPASVYVVRCEAIVRPWGHA